MEKCHFNNAVIIAGMKFDPINACAHRMTAIAKLLAKYCDKVSLFGVGKNISQGIHDSFLYKTIKYPDTLFSWFKYAFSAKTFIKYLKNNKGIDLVVVNGSIPSIPTRKIAKFCKRKHIKFIFDIDEWNHKSTDKFPRNIVKNYDTWLKMHKLCKIYDNYIVPGSYLFKHCYSESKNVFIIPALVTKKESVIHKEKEKNAVILSFVGLIERHGAKENLTELISAINEFNALSKVKFYLNIIGVEGTNTDYVKYFGILNYNNCVNAVANSDFTVIPRFKNRKNQAGFPTKLSESFLYGVPVIATDTSDIHKYIINGENGFLIKENNKDQFIECFKNIEKNYCSNKNYFDELHLKTNDLNRLKIEYFVNEFNLFINKI